MTKNSITSLLLYVVIHQTTMCQQFPFRTYTTRDGLISSAATAIVQDSNGYIWIGSYNGLSIFDGVTFKNHSPSEGLPASHISHFVESKRIRNVMWVGTFGGGVLKFTDGKFQQYRIGTNDFHDQVRSLAEDDRGVLWVGTNDGVFLFRENEITRFDSKASIGAVMQIVEMRDSLIWISPFNQSVLCFSLAGNSATRMDISHISRTFRKRRIFLGGMTGGLFVVKHSAGAKDTLIQYTVENGLPFNSVNVFFADQHNTSASLFTYFHLAGSFANELYGAVESVYQPTSYR